MLEPEVRAIMMGLQLEHIGAVVDETRTLASGFHPLSAKDTPNGACLILNEPKDTIATGWVVTDWNGDALTPRVPVTSEADTVEKAVHAVVKLWADIINSIRTGTAHDMPELVRALTPRTTPHPMPALQVGEHVAYLLPDIPPFIQDKFVIAKVIGVNPLALANGHHKTIFASGRGEVARYNPTTGRVVFPVGPLINLLK